MKDADRHASKQPTKEQVDRWLSSFWKRWLALVVLPCTVIWLWVAVPFPVADPYSPDETFHWDWRWPWSSPDLFRVLRTFISSDASAPPPGPPAEDQELPVDLNFLFFLLFFFGAYLQFALLFMVRLHCLPSATRLLSSDLRRPRSSTSTGSTGGQRRSEARRPTSSSGARPSSSAGSCTTSICSVLARRRTEASTGSARVRRLAHIPLSQALMFS